MLSIVWKVKWKTHVKQCDVGEVFMFYKVLHKFSGWHGSVILKPYAYEKFPFLLLVVQVMDAEKQKADSGAFHHEKTVVFNAAELKVSNVNCCGSWLFIKLFLF